MGTIQQLINDLRAWKYLVTDDANTHSSSPPPGSAPRRRTTPVWARHPGSTITRTGRPERRSSTSPDRQT